MLIPIKGNARFLTKDDLAEPIIATIDCVTFNDKLNNPHVLHFDGKQIKPLPLNLVNRRALVAAYGQDDEGWRGRPIEIYVNREVTNSSGEVVGGIRLRVPANPPAPPSPPPSYGRPLPPTPQRIPATPPRPSTPPATNGHRTTANTRAAGPPARTPTPAAKTPTAGSRYTPPAKPANAPAKPASPPTSDLASKHRRVIDGMIKADSWEQVMEWRTWSGKIAFTEEQFTEQDHVFEDRKHDFGMNVPF